MLFLRGQIVGSVSDLERAGSLVADIVRRDPASTTAQQLGATSAMAFHRFSEVRAALERAEKAGIDPREFEATRAALAQTTGDIEAALPVLRENVRRLPGIDTRIALAIAESERGRVQDAARLFAEAQDAYRDVSPFPIAYLYFQEGLMWAREGKQGLARTLFEAAVDRVPAYAPAVSHLAQMLAHTGERKRAVILMRGLIQSSDDPEHKALLADLVEAEGGRAEAVTLRAAAKAGFEDLLSRHPEAFADHAARFFLGEGHDPARALALAKANVANRGTREAMQLVVEAALAANEKDLACSTASTLSRAAYVAAAARVLLARAFVACGRDKDVEAQLSAAGLTRAALTSPRGVGALHTH
jgi:tetratricopeptide (TPR) repeat protein